MTSSLIDMSLDEIIKINKKKKKDMTLSQRFQRKYQTVDHKKTHLQRVQLQYGKINRKNFKGQGNHVNFFRQKYLKQHTNRPFNAARFTNLQVQVNTSYKQRYAAKKLKQSKLALIGKMQRNNGFWNWQQRRNLKKFQYENVSKINWQQQQNNLEKWEFSSVSSVHSGRQPNGFLGRSWETASNVSGVSQAGSDILTVSFTNNLANRQSWRRGNRRGGFVKNLLTRRVSQPLGFEVVRGPYNRTSTTLNDRFSFM